MRKRKSIDLIELESLKNSGISNQALARKYKVSPATIKRRRREAAKTAIDFDIKDYARKLELLIAEAPNDSCKKLTTKLVNQIRTVVALSPERKKQIILNWMRNNPYPVTAAEIAEGIKFLTQETARLLEEMVDENLAVRQEQTRSGQRSRTKNFYYRLSSF